MRLKEFSKIEIGDMVLVYIEDEDTKRCTFTIVPKEMKDKKIFLKEGPFGLDSLVQLKIIGDKYPGVYSGGTSMRNSESTLRLKLIDQHIEEDKHIKKIITTLKDDRNYYAYQIITYYRDEKSFEIHTEFLNKSEKDITLEMISSFSLGNITPFSEGDAPNELLLHRLRSKWSSEGRLDTTSLEDLQLEPSWCKYQFNSERFGQVGSMPVKHFFPYAVIEDSKNNVFWGVQLSIASSWQMEVYRRDDSVNLSGGIADREFGHWMKKVKPHEKFKTPSAIVTVCSGGGIDKVSSRLTNYAEKFVIKGPKSEQSLPIIFNEYCTTWGCPSEENIASILENIKDKGIEYFVIDAGWFKPKGTSWDTSMGDYEVSEELFKSGLEKTVQKIKDAGMKPGIWFEIENVAINAKAYNMEDHLLKRDGYTLTTEGRRFFDMNDPYVKEYLNEKVINFLKKYKFEYIKIDYNDTIGIGCDNSDSLGEGLRQNIEGTKEFIRRIKTEIPEIVIENCASGGHRLEPSMMAYSSMASFSDAHECKEIPVIAANLQRAILPRQSQIWCVIRKDDSLKRISYSICATFLGRMCFSGDVTNLNEKQWDLINEGISFYKNISPIIKSGTSYRYGDQVRNYRHLEGYQAIVRVGENKESVVIIHTFDGVLPEYIKIKLPEGCGNNIDTVYSDSDCNIEIANNTLIYKTTSNMKGIAIKLK